MNQIVISSARGALAFVCAMTAVPALAGTLSKIPTALDPAKAYVVVEIGKIDDGLLYGSLVLGRYDEAAADIAQATSPPAGGPSKKNGALENRISVLKAAVKDGDRRLYVVELEPGLWAIEGANDTAFSLGSSTVRLEAGTVTDLGVVKVYSDFPDGQKRDVLTAGRALKGALMGGIFGSTVPQSMPKAIEVRARARSDLAIPAVLSGSAHPVEWSGQVTFGNHLGGLVNRMGGRKARSMVAEQNRLAKEEVNRADAGLVSHPLDSGETRQPFENSPPR